MIIADESDDMNCTGFNSEVDKFYDLFEVNKVSLEDIEIMSLILSDKAYFAGLLHSKRGCQAHQQSTVQSGKAV